MSSCTSCALSMPLCVPFWLSAGVPPCAISPLAVVPVLPSLPLPPPLMVPSGFAPAATRPSLPPLAAISVAGMVTVPASAPVPRVPRLSLTTAPFESVAPMPMSVASLTALEAAGEEARTILHTSAQSALTPPTVPRFASPVFNAVWTPLKATAFDAALRRYGLLSRYPTLVSHILNGFPIGLDIPPLTSSYLPPNHYTTGGQAAIIQTKIDAEVALSCMSGPFSVADAELFCGGPIRTSPLGLVPKPGAIANAWRMIQNLSFRGSPGFSVNDLIDSDDFPTRWGSAQELADWVRVCFWD